MQGLVPKDGACQEAVGGTERPVLILTKVNPDPRSDRNPRQEKNLDGNRMVPVRVHADVPGSPVAIPASWVVG